MLADAGAQAEFVDETRFRQRFSGALGRYRTINDFHGRATRSGGYAQVRFTAGPSDHRSRARADHWTLTDETTASPWVQGSGSCRASTTIRGGTGIYRQFPEFEQVIGDARAALAPVRNEPISTIWGSNTASERHCGGRSTVFDREESGFFRRPARKRGSSTGALFAAW